MEEAARGEGGHKRKKEKEQPMESGPKKKVSPLCVCGGSGVTAMMCLTLRRFLLPFRLKARTRNV